MLRDRERSDTEENLSENLAELVVKPSMLKEAQDHMSDLEWDHDFVASDEVNEKRSLLRKDNTDEEADRWWLAH